MDGIDDEWVYLEGDDGIAAVVFNDDDAKEEAGVADNGGSDAPAPAPADCASCDESEVTTGDGECSGGERELGDHNAVEEDGASSAEEEAAYYSDDGIPDNYYNSYYYDYDVRASALATSGEHDCGVGEYYGYRYYDYDAAEFYGGAAACYAAAGNHLAGYQPPVYQPYYVPGSGMYPPLPASYFFLCTSAPPSSPYLSPYFAYATPSAPTTEPSA